jgi:N-acetyl sugar amidotransferase
MDTSDPDIMFDSEGCCNHCTNAIARHKAPPHSLTGDEKSAIVRAKVDEMRKAGEGKRYDCLIGLSGGVDSTFVARAVKGLGLRPLAVHLDNGWDSELAVKNIENICTKLGIDLVTLVLDWETFKALQIAFLRASTPDSEIPSDHAIFASMYKIAKRHGIGYIVSGYNAASESILPAAWSQGHFDWKYIRSVNRLFGGKPLRGFPHFGFMPFVRLVTGKAYVPGIEMFNLLDFLEYDKEEAKRIIARELDWRDYGRKHGESNYTKIFQEYILPKKFGFDKRRAHYSSLIAAGQLERSVALSMLEEPLYKDERSLEEDIGYLVNKLGLTREEFDAILSALPKRYSDYPNYPNSILYKGLRSIYRAFIKPR